MLGVFITSIRPAKLVGTFELFELDPEPDVACSPYEDGSLVTSSLPASRLASINPIV